jgi:type I restriction enzyme S subunit
LKQAILQEAIAGQLTAEWRTENPMQKGNPDTDATALLAKIKAEKQQAIADGKLKKEKPLAEIAIDEVPFSIPDTWVWTITEDICFAIVDCPHSTPKYQEEGKNCIDTTCFDEEGVIKKVRKVDEFTFIERNQRLEPLQGDIVYSREGIIGQAVILPESPNFCLGQRVMLFRPWKCIQSKMLRLIIVSPFFRQQMIEKHKGMGAKHVNMKDLRSGLIPLPPLAEQKAIVEKVDRLMNIIDQLEQQIKHRKQLAEDLMQTVLREAFE